MFQLNGSQHGCYWICGNLDRARSVRSTKTTLFSALICGLSCTNRAMAAPVCTTAVTPMFGVWCAQ